MKPEHAEYIRRQLGDRIQELEATNKELLEALEAAQPSLDEDWRILSEIQADPQKINRAYEIAATVRRAIRKAKGEAV